MRSRRRWLVGYDIRDPKRLSKVMKVVEAHGERLQFSVFLCDLDGMEFKTLQFKLNEIIHHRRDSVVFIDLGEWKAITPMKYLGIKLVEPDEVPTIF